MYISQDFNNLYILDQKIDSSELSKLFAYQNYTCPVFIQNVMHKLDMDRNGVLNYDEFQNLMQNQNGFSSVREAFQESFFCIFFYLFFSAKMSIYV